MTTIDTRASRNGSSQRPSDRPTLIFMPEVNSDSSTTTSAMCSSSVTWSKGSIADSPKTSGLTATPAARYSIDVLSGSRASTDWLRAITTSNRPTMADHKANCMPAAP